MKWRNPPSSVQAAKPSSVHISCREQNASDGNYVDRSKNKGSPVNRENILKKVGCQISVRAAEPSSIIPSDCRFAFDASSVSFSAETTKSHKAPASSPPTLPGGYGRTNASAAKYKNSARALARTHPIRYRCTAPGVRLRRTRTPSRRSRMPSRPISSRRDVVR